MWLVPSRLFLEDKADLNKLLTDSRDPQKPESVLDYVWGHIVGGKNSDMRGADSAISPAIRTSAMHFIFAPVCVKPINLL